jgi:serine/threonine-protein kinase HipA
MSRQIRALDIWMNGLHVGRWERTRSGADQLVYAPAWMQAREGRPLSLSLPFARNHVTGQGAPLRSAAVAAYFDNLIPDNDRILRRLRDRYAAASTSAFDLLAAIGRDCAGAVQLVPAGETPGDTRRIEAEPLNDAGVARLLRDITAGTPLERAEADALRLSIAGAQEKTALLRHRGRWCIPRGATPSTHIFKLPLGLVGNIRADLGDSVEIEWLSMRIAHAFGLPVAHAEIGRFENQKALVVERFDRARSRDRTWWQRIPQEDFCQALGLPPSRKYEADGGPGMRRIMDLLRGSDTAAQDRATFFRAQLLFWLMAATDGHAKNFSLRLLPDGAYRLTPLYDILSIHPLLGNGAGKLDPRKARLAMAVEGRNRHYVLHDIHRWHWTAMATRLGVPDAAGLVEQMAAQVAPVLQKVGDALPDGFPEAIFAAVGNGMLRSAKRLAAEPDRRA